MQKVQFYRQHANVNHMLAQHYSIEYRKGGKCVYPLVALSIFVCSRKKTRMTVHHFNSQSLCKY